MTAAAETSVDTNIAAPLGALAGHRPDAPTWFTSALKREPNRTLHTVHGAPIETLTWGDVGKPGLLLLHGKMAHADWWSFIAPFFADHYRVAALSWSGMGRSGWRDAYSIELMTEEIDAVARAAGLFEGSAPPVLVGHSFGAFAGLHYAAERGAALGGLITLDLPLLSREQRQAQAARRSDDLLAPPRANRVYATLPDALARFRFAPPQRCDNLFIADFVARISLKQVAREGEVGSNGEPGWTWRFDPKIWHGLRPGDRMHGLAQAQCPLAVMWGACSELVNPDIVKQVATLAPAGTPFIEIPAARHHVMVDEPMALVAALRALLSTWPLVRATTD